MTEKQALAFEYLTDLETNEILFGGAGGGGKSLLGCGWIIWSCMRYPASRWCIAREELKSIKETTLLTFWDLCRKWGLKRDVHFRYNETNGIITFWNRSTVYLRELKFYPTDSEYDYLGSSEYTGAFIDEISQVTQKGKNVLRSRIRYKLAEFGLIPKLLGTCNPHKGYLYKDFYRPYKDGTLAKNLKFVQALPGDNPFLDQSYIENLRGLDKQTRERLLYGNWEYDDDPTVLCDIDAINDMFSNHVKPSTQKYIIADIARFGDDKTVISYWEGWECKYIKAYGKLPTVPDMNNPGIKSSSGIIEEWRKKYGVPLSHVLVDEDGMGGGPKDYLGCRGFMGGKSPYRGQNYMNLRSQCYYFISKKINLREIAVRTADIQLRNAMIEEFEHIKAWNRDKDSKRLQIIPKDEIKKHIGRSPDFSDTIMMRAMFEFLPMPKIETITIR